MNTPTAIQSIYINLPVRDLARTRDFWSKLGFAFNEQFSDEKALCLQLKGDEIVAMLLQEDFFQTFTNRSVADGKSTQVLLAIDVGSREKVDHIMRVAVENGAERYLQPQDEGWMYYDRFADPDGHQWEVMSLEQLPPQLTP